MSALDRFGQDVARAMGERAPSQLRARVRGVVVARVSERQSWRSKAWLPVTAALFIVCALLVWRRTSSLDAATVHGKLAEGDWLTAPLVGDLKVTFEDRGHATLAGQTRARLARLSSSRVELALESGELDVDVKPRSGTTWSIAAGPFRVEVLGTAFETSWKPEAEELTVLVRRGTVRVTGAALSQHGVELRAGETLKANARRGQTLLGREPASDSERAAIGTPSQSASAAFENPSPPPVVLEQSANVERQPPSSERFRELARSGKHDEALALAEELGFESLISTSSAPDLELLANAARYQKRSDEARRALLALRRRFPGSSQAATATFLLGRLAAEQSADYAGAAKWFLTYSNEYPTRPLAAEALGRRVQLLALAGENESARTAAERYLERYPGGPYASVARGVLAGRKLKSGP